MNTQNVISSLEKLPAPQQREIVARLLTQQSSLEIETIWKVIRFRKNLRIVAYTAEQEKFVKDLYEILQRGTLARNEDQADGNWEIYGSTRTYYVTISSRKEFVGLLDSWLLETPPREIDLPELT